MQVGAYLHTARVKVIDNDHFPSSKYGSELEVEDLEASCAAFTVISTTYISKIHLESTGNRPPNALICLIYSILALFPVEF